MKNHFLLFLARLQDLSHFVFATSGLDSDLGELDVAVDVEPVVLAREHHGPVVHEGDVEALGVLHLALESRNHLKHFCVYRLSLNRLGSF